MSQPHPNELLEPVRNRWFTGKMLDAYHMELETDYGDRKRGLINRLVLGSGVAQGLDVKPGPEPRSVIVTPGLAIDWHGREIIVPGNAPPRAWKVPDDDFEKAKQHQHENPQQGEHEQRGRGGDHHHPHHHKVRIRVEICYYDDAHKSAPADPGSGCGCDPAAGLIHEKYRVCFDPHPAKLLDCRCRVPQLIQDNELIHAALARYVTRHVPPERKSPCITLANIDLPLDDKNARCEAEHIDITVRPIVYSNDLLFEMILGLLNPDRTAHGDTR